MSSADWREWFQFKLVDFDHRVEQSGTFRAFPTNTRHGGFCCTECNTPHRGRSIGGNRDRQKETLMRNSVGGVWLNFFGWQRPVHWPMPKPTAKPPQPTSKPNPNPLGWSEEALAAMKELEELFD